VYDDRTFNALSARQDWTLAVSPRFMMRWGADVARERADYVYSNSIQRDSAGPRQPDGVRPHTTYTSVTNIVIEPSSTRTGIYTSERFRPLEPLTVEAGVRYDRNSITNDAARVAEAECGIGSGRRNDLASRLGRTSQSQSLGSIHVEDGVRSPLPAKRAEHVVRRGGSSVDGGILARVEMYQRLQSRCGHSARTTPTATSHSFPS
jgi:outer membrane receptor protein involved in Fe transport